MSQTSHVAPLHDVLHAFQLVAQSSEHSSPGAFAATACGEAGGAALALALAEASAVTRSAVLGGGRRRWSARGEAIMWTCFTSRSSLGSVGSSDSSLKRSPAYSTRSRDCP